MRVGVAKADDWRGWSVEGYAERGAAFASERDSLPRGIPLFRTLVDDSEAVGDGGVMASDVAEETDLAGGVATVGDEAVVPGDLSGGSINCEVASPASRWDGLRHRLSSDSALRSFSCTISASILRSENSSRRR